VWGGEPERGYQEKAAELIFEKASSPQNRGTRTAKTSQAQEKSNSAYAGETSGPEKENLWPQLRINLFSITNKQAP